MISLKNRRIALIGGGGFIGHHLAVRLRGLGAEVHIVDNLMVNNFISIISSESQQPNQDLYMKMLNARIALLKKHDVPIHVQDARDYHKLSQVLEAINPDAIIHLAAVAHANRSNKDPYNTFDHSLRTLENALDFARGSNIEHFIYFSSSMVYGNFQGEFVTEETPCEPLGIYGALKYSGEKIVIAYNQVFNLPYTIIRPSALYGERCISGRVGQQFIEKALTGNEIKIEGDGSSRLDFTYIEDFVNGIVRVLEHETSRGEIFNLTFGQGRSLKNMADILKEAFPEVKIQYIPKDRLMPERGTLCMDKMKNLLNFEPANPLDIGYMKYIEWYKSFV